MSPACTSCHGFIIKVIVFPQIRHRATSITKRIMETVDSEILDPIQEALLNEMCILVDENDNDIGSASKKDCHLLRNGICMCNCVRVYR